MGGQAEPGIARWLALGAVLGLLTAGMLVSAWHRDARGLSVTVLGAGRQASVLITSHHRRVLIAAGTSGDSFANAVADALPPIDNELDVILIDPAASPDVIERARALEARLVWTLPAIGDPAVADTIERSFDIDFDDETRLRLVLSPDTAWHAALTSTAGTVLIAPNATSISDQRGAAVAILTREPGDAKVTVPLLVALPGTSTESDQQLRVASPGSIIRLDIGDGEIRT